MFRPLLCFNTGYQQRLSVGFCCEQRSTAGQCGIVYTAVLLAEALVASARYGNVMSRARSSTDAMI